MASLVQTGQYGAINTTYTSTIGYYVIKFTSELYTLQEETKCDVKTSTTGALVVKSQYMNCIQYNTKLYW